MPSTNISQSVRDLVKRARSALTTFAYEEYGYCSLEEWRDPGPAFGPLKESIIKLEGLIKEEDEII